MVVGMVTKSPIQMKDLQEEKGNNFERFLNYRRAVLTNNECEKGDVTINMEEPSTVQQWTALK